METFLDSNDRIWKAIRARGLDPESPGAGEAISFLAGGGRLLDVGCGSGKAAAKALNRFDIVVGLDVSATAVGMAAARGLRAARADLGRGFAPFAEAAFDAVTCLDAIEHFTDAGSVLAEIYRVLRPGGRVVLTTVNIRFAGHLLSLLRGSVPRTADLSALGRECLDCADGHVSFFTRASLEKDLRARGFQVILCTGRQPATPYPLSSRPIRPFLPARWKQDLFCRGLIAVAEKPRARGARASACEPRDRSPRISTIVVSWNTRDELAGCLAELEVARAAAPGGIETIIVDNGSTDGSPEHSGVHDPGATLLRNRINVGFGRAANQGIRRATGSFILLLNPDVRLPAESLSLLIEAMVSNPTLGAVGPSLTAPDGGPAMSYLHTPGPRALLGWFLERRGLARLAARLGPREPPCGTALADVDSVLGGCILIRAKAIAEVGGFDERFFLYAEDLDLCRRLRHGGWRVALARRAVATHACGRATGQDPAGARREWIRSHRFFYRKHGLRLSRIVFEVLTSLDRALGRSCRKGAP